MDITINKLYKFLINKPAHSLFVLIYASFILNYIFCFLSVAFGAPVHNGTIIFGSYDLFADYFKVTFSYPHSFNLHLNEASALLNSYLIENPYGGILALSQGGLTHFHLTPLSTLFSLLNLNLMHDFDPRLLFTALIVSMILLPYFLLKASALSKTDAFLFFLSFILCYPTLFFIARGNILSGIVAISLIAYLVLVFKNKSFLLALLLLAFAVNVRPNAIIFIFAIFIAENRPKLTGLIYFTLLTVAIFFTSLEISNVFYPEYTLGHFINGLNIYHSIYVIGNLGLASGSSLFGALKFVFGYANYFELIVSIISALLLLNATFCVVNHKLSKPIYLFILCALYTLCSSVFADYHLMVFWGPLLVICSARNNDLYQSPKLMSDRDFLIIFFSCVFVLVPKNYLFIQEVSLQVFLNPILLLSVTFMLLASADHLSRLHRA